jgi:glutamine cyclotransferase
VNRQTLSTSSSSGLRWGAVVLLILGVGGVGLWLAGSAPPRATSQSPDRAETPPAVFGYELVHTYPHDPEAFTQGLTIADGFLYEGTGLEGRSTLRRVDLETGRVLQHVNLPGDLFGEGIAVRGDEIVQLTWRDGFALVHDRTTFREKRRIPYAGEGWGLTSDGPHLVASNGTATLYFLKPANFEVARQVEVKSGGQPVQQLNELEWVEGEVFANVWYQDRIARIDPATGRVVGWIDLTGLYDSPRRDKEDVLNGIAYDAKTKRLFVTGKNWPNLFEIKIQTKARR